MKYAFLLAVLLANVASAKDVFVDGHVRKDGIYVAPHHRTAPDRYPYNNYGTQGNYNPYTGQAGMQNPYQVQQQYQPQPYQIQPYNNRGNSSIGGR